MFGLSGACNACGQTIQPNEMVMRTTTGGGGNSQTATGAVNGAGMNGQLQHQVFHPNCFACSKCAIQLKPGDRYYMLAGSLVCEQDWQKLVKTSGTGTGATPPIRKGKVGRPRRSRDCDDVAPPTTAGRVGRPPISSLAGNNNTTSHINNPGSNSINQNNSTSVKLMAGAAGLLGHPQMSHLGGSPVPDVGPVAPPVKAKYQRTTKGRKSQKVNLMLAAAAEESSTVANATSPLLMPQRGNFGPPMAGNYGQMVGGGGFMENGGGGGGGGGFQHQFYDHIHDGSPHSFYGGGVEGQQAMAGNCLRVMPSFEQDFMRGQQQQQQQQQRPFYTTGGGGGMMGGGLVKKPPMEMHEQDYDALHRHHVSSPSSTSSLGPGMKRDCHGDANNNNCDFSEMRMFNGIKSEFPGEDHSSSGGGGGRLRSPMTNPNGTPPEDVLEEL